MFGWSLWRLLPWLWAPRLFFSLTACFTHHHITLPMSNSRSTASGPGGPCAGTRQVVGEAEAGAGARPVSLACNVSMHRHVQAPNLPPHAFDSIQAVHPISCGHTRRRATMAGPAPRTSTTPSSSRPCLARRPACAGEAAPSQAASSCSGAGGLVGHVRWVETCGC